MSVTANWAIFTPEFVEQLRAEGHTVYGSHCKTEAQLRRAFELGLDQLSTTALQLALEVRGSIQDAG